MFLSIILLKKLFSTEKNLQNFCIMIILGLFIIRMATFNKNVYFFIVICFYLVYGLMY